MKFIILGEVHIYEIQEFSADVCRDVFAEGGLNQMIFRFLLRLCVADFSNFNLCSYPALCNAC